MNGFFSADGIGGKFISDITSTAVKVGADIIEDQTPVWTASILGTQSVDQLARPTFVDTGNQTTTQNITTKADTSAGGKKSLIPGVSNMVLILGGVGLVGGLFFLRGK